MDYRPNVDAALQLIEKIMPLVRRDAPQAHPHDRRPRPRARSDPPARGSEVTVTGYVDDVRRYLERASVAAVPLRFGAGIQNKVLEAMAMGLPVVASSVAAEGLRLAKGSGPPVAVDNFDWGRSGAAFRDLLEGLLVTGGRPS